MPGADRAVVPGTEPPFTTPLRYRLQTLAPPNWIPFQPVKVSSGLSEIALELSKMALSAAPSEPRGKILHPKALPECEPYRIAEEEVPREGTRLARLRRWCRWIDGSTHVWIGRRRGVGTGEGSSGLRFDVALTPR